MERYGYIQHSILQLVYHGKETQRQKRADFQHIKANMFQKQDKYHNILRQYPQRYVI